MIFSKNHFYFLYFLTFRNTLGEYAIRLPFLSPFSAFSLFFSAGVKWSRTAFGRYRPDFPSIYPQSSSDHFVSELHLRFEPLYDPPFFLYRATDSWAFRADHVFGFPPFGDRLIVCFTFSHNFGLVRFGEQLLRMFILYRNLNYVNWW